MVIAALSTQTWPRPFLKWAGGKGRLLEQYYPYFPKSFDTYYEPFLGGGAIFFHLTGRFRTAVLADINPELVNVYQCVRNQVEDLIALLQEHRQQHSQTHYYAVRSQTELSCSVQRAARLIYLNKTCYNGLYRENSKGHFNVPMGRYKKPAICDPDLLRSAALALQSAHIKQASFDFVLQRATSRYDFVYFDPPYYPISATSNFTGYSRYGFTTADQEQLSQVFATLAERGVQVMLSNSDCPFIRDLYAGFNIHTIQATRAINSKACRRGKITELLITSY
ncbi:MAG: DNA adenine methylase [Cyanobacteria bacterium Co-bin8]|nr:DNA adenine methylase [Cyanobacteria bacterium Co-bin8]